LPVIDGMREIAAQAGALAMERFRGSFDRWEKSPGNPVSEVDLIVDRFLHNALHGLDPAAGWLSEETADNAERLKGRRVWVVDPIDGTRDFVRGRDGWCVSIALVEDGKVLAGVLDAPAKGDHWYATAGGGAFRNDRALAASQCGVLAQARVPADALPKGETDFILVEKPNSIALRMAMVAADEADLVATLRWGHEWDLPAAALIAHEAGAVVTDGLGQPISYNKEKPEVFGVLVTSRSIHAAAVERLAERAAKAVQR
jgi:myo-inositol-1(or 4)-monophosphatase